LNWRKRKKKDKRRRHANRRTSAGATTGPSKALIFAKVLTGNQPMVGTKQNDDPQAELRRRIAELPLLAEARVVAAASVADISPDGRGQLERRIALGSSETLSNARGGIPLDAVLGIDFGTSSTKIVARLPYLPGTPSFAVPALGFASAERHPHLWESRLWMTSAGVFSLAPEKESGVLCSIKTNLMAPDCERRLVMHAPGKSATALECAIAFLALQIRQARGWLYDHHAASLGRGPLRWHYNVGLPAAKLDQSHTVRHYQTCLAAAVDAARMPDVVSLDLIRGIIDGMVQIRQRLDSQRATLQPEIAAAVAGFAHSRRRKDGLYAMVDVGAGTMDCCTFALTGGNHGDRCPIFAADISLLGIQPFELCNGDQGLRKCFATEVKERICEVIRPTRNDKYPNSPRWREGLPVFLVGGGKPSPVHKAEIVDIDRNMKQNQLGGLKLLELPEPDNMVHLAKTDELHRLAVAVGLSLPKDDIPQVELPTSIGDIAPMRQRDYEKNYVGSEMV
jgi:hypothetical protein